MTLHGKDNERVSLRPCYSPFWPTPLIYAEKFEFKNPAIMEDKQCKQMEQFLAMAKESNYFLSLDDKSKQIYKVKITNMQGYDPYQIKSWDFQAMLVNFHQCHSLFNYFLYSLSPLTKEELKM